MNIVQFFGFTWPTGQCSIAGQSSTHKKRSLLEFFLIDPKSHDGLPRWLSGKESTYQCRRHGFDPRVGKIPWRRKWQPTPEFLPGKFHEQRSLAGYSLRGPKESDTTEQLSVYTYSVLLPKNLYFYSAFFSTLVFFTLLFYII